jgi:hypothetical protein
MAPSTAFFIQYLSNRRVRCCGWYCCCYRKTKKPYSVVVVVIDAFALVAAGYTVPSYEKTQVHYATSLLLRHSRRRRSLESNRIHGPERRLVLLNFAVDGFGLAVV